MSDLQAAQKTLHHWWHYGLLLKGTSSLLQLAIIWVLSQCLFPADMGQFSWVYAGWVLCRMVGGLGRDQLAMQQLPVWRRQKAWRAIQGYYLGSLGRTFLACIAIMLALFWWVAPGWSWPMVVLSIVAGIAYGCFGVVTAFWRGHEKPQQAQWPEMLCLPTAQLAALACLCWADNPTLDAVLLLFSLLAIAAGVASTLHLMRWQHGHALLSVSEAMHQQPAPGQAIALWLAALAMNLAMRCPVFYLAWLGTPAALTQAAVLEIALRLARPISWLSGISNLAVAPILATLEQDDRRSLLRSASRLPWLLALLGWCGLCTLGLPIIYVGFGSAYQGAYPALLWLASGFALNAFSGGLIPAYIHYKRAGWVAFWSILQGLFVLGLTILAHNWQEDVPRAGFLACVLAAGLLVRDGGLWIGLRVMERHSMAQEQTA